LLVFAKGIDKVTLPEMRTDEGKRIIFDVKILLVKVSKFLKENAEKL
jgi:hypothetical protein